MCNSKCENDIRVLKEQVRYLRRSSIEFYEYIDTVSSPVYKRLWWWLGGYHFTKVGRWYSKGKLFKVWYFFAKLIKCP